VSVDLDAAALGVESSITGRAWRMRRVNERLAGLLAQRHDLDEIVGRVLAGRGVTAETAADFLAPSLKTSLPDPSAFKDMDIAAERIAAAVVAGERVAVFGDYDVDGATSSALLARFFGALGHPVRVYIPDRIEEGYGPNAAAMRRLAEEGMSLVITVDCGTLAFEALEAAAEAGLEVIVADHHKAETRLPPALGVINPNRLDESGEYGQLAAVGVTFLLVVAVNRALRRAGWYGAGRAEPDLRQWLDLVALGTVCDVVPLTGANRAFVAQGLKVMARRGNAGLAALSDVARLEQAPAVYHLGFLLGPRVNAGGRVGEAGLGAELLASDDPAAARQIAERLDLFNAERRALEAGVLDAAHADLVRRFGAEAPDPVAFAAREGWHPGVIGIVASRLVERTGRPSFVIGIDADGTAKGSARSIPGVDIGTAIIAAAEAGVIERGGGHAMAAGFTLRADALAAFERFIAERLAAKVAAARAGRSLELDGTLAVKGCRVELVESLEALGPYGIGNPSPRFALPRLELVKADIVGKDHLRAIFAGGDGGRIKAMAFRQAGEPLGEALRHGLGRRFHIAGRLKRDDWGATPKVEMTLEDAAEA